MLTQGDISSRTVKAHITNVKERLGCDSFFQLGMVYQSLDYIL
jgi:DNA-binding CsgD family transcriptional regulator